MKTINCPLQVAAKTISGKWKSIIIFQLSLGNASLSKLQKDILGISQKMLLQHLKELKDDGLIDKINYDGYPLKVEYFLTNRGKEMLKAIMIFQQIGIQIMQENNTYHLLSEEALQYLQKSK